MIIKDTSFDEERALYHSDGVELVGCSFAGPADGESALKESRNVTFRKGFCNLRYPFWHVEGLVISDTRMTPLCRAALWYTKNASITGTELHGIKAVRECSNISIDRCSIDSTEFGWFSDLLSVRNTTAKSEYPFLRSSHLSLYRFQLDGKYSFQYISSSVLIGCTLNTKDAFWHAKNVYVKDSVINGEYLGWYSENVTFENCIISGTQPLCYCKNLKLIHCEMRDADLSFELSDVEATLTAPIESIKNPKSGTIRVPSVGLLIMEDGAEGKVITDVQAHGSDC